MLSIGSLALSLLLMVALSISVLRRTNHALDIPAGLVVAENVMNQMIYNVQNDIPGGTQAAFFAAPTVPTAPAAFTAGTFAMNRIDFTYTTDIQNLGVGNLMVNNRLIQFRVVVRWQEPTGSQTSSLTRLVHQDG